uniref:Uncharacterized protein n=1 Tax=Parascaris equorum TaxID=6256 RepID=A0A914RC78_PAREQ
MHKFIQVRVLFKMTRHQFRVEKRQHIEDSKIGQTQTNDNTNEMEQKLKK